MTISFIVEDGSIVPGANSLVSVADADAIAATDFTNGPLWLAIADPTEKQARLIAATQWVHERVIWNGKRVTDPKYPYRGNPLDQTWVIPPLNGPAATPVTPQPLDFPRRDCRDREGRWISRTIVPDETKRLVTLVAFYFLQDAAQAEAMQGVRIFRADTFQLEFQNSYQLAAVPDWCKFVLNGLGTMGADYGQKKIRRV